MFRHKLQIPNLILIAICLVVIITVYLLNVINTSINERNKNATTTLTAQDSVIQYLESCKNDLYLAGNAYDFYISTNNAIYKEEFSSHINHFITNLDNSHLLENKSTDPISINLQQKVHLSNTLVKLKKLADSILTESLNYSTLDEPQSLAKVLSRLIVNKTVERRDTVKYVPIKTKKSLIKKIASIFKDEDEQLSTITNQSSVTYKNDSLLTHKGNSLDAEAEKSKKSIKKYYASILRKELEIRHKIDKKNKQAALYNKAIFTDLQNEITEITNSVNQSHKNSTFSAITDLRDYNRKQNYLFISSLVALAILLLLLGYKVMHTRRYENKILLDRQQAIALSDMKASFLNTMSHEIRTPLTAIIGFADHISSKGIDANTPEYINNIKYASDHLLETVNDVLEFSKLESGKVSIANAPFLINDLLENTINTYKLQAQKKQLNLFLQSSIQRTLIVVGDVFHLRQVLYNLINNAIKFTDKGSITLHAYAHLLSDKKQELTFIVQDTGRGIEKNALESVFKEFVQIKEANENTTKTTKGTGLGLSISQKLVTLMGGTIRLESEVNVGSKFIVTIPFIVEKNKSNAPAVRKADSNQLIGKKVLLAEDSESIIILASMLLKDMKVEVDIAKNGEEAWGKFNTNPDNYDYILTDIEMPGLNGNDLARRIRASYYDISIIAITGHTSSEEYERFKQDGIDATITKPFKKNELIDVLIANLKKYH